MPHNCHAINCDTPVPPSMFMCRHHWGMVPDYLQNLIKTAYRPGQEKDRNPSRVWVKYAKQARAHVLSLEKAESELE